MYLWKRIAVVLISMVVVAALIMVFMAEKPHQEAIAQDAGPNSVIAYMSVTGQSQGQIRGSVQESGREGTIALHAINHLIDIPFDTASGEPSGVPQHHQFSITKVVDSASVKLYQALMNQEQLTVVKIDFYQLNNQGSEVQYYNITLSDAMIVSISDMTPKKFESGETVNMPAAEISFTYKSINWNLSESGDEFTSSWGSIAR